MKLLNVDTLDEAREKLLTATSEKRPAVARVPLKESFGRILADDVKSEDNIPDFRKSTVDGYAVRAADTQGAGDSIPVFLEVIESVNMGEPPARKIEPGQATYVPTGGMLPEGADAMVMIEYCEKFDESSIAVYDSVSPGRNMVAVGEDVSRGQVIMEKGTRITAREAGVMASAGVHMPEVFAPWKITVISTGDELVAAEDKPEPGQVRDINTYSVMAAAESKGFRVVNTAVIKDVESELEEAVGTAMGNSDIVVVSGGSSQGDKDHTACVLDRLSHGGVFTHGIALKPGKPTILGYDRTSETILVGLPGHPAAALMVFELLIGWLHRKLTGQREPLSVPAVITENVPAAGGRTTCQMVKLEKQPGGIYDARPLHGKSALMTTLTQADGYVMIDVNREGINEGDTVEVVLF